MRPALIVGLKKIIKKIANEAAGKIGLASSQLLWQVRISMNLPNLAKQNVKYVSLEMTLCWGDGACTLLYFLPVLSISSMLEASGLFSWTIALLAFASRQFAPKSMDLSARFIHSHFVKFFLVNERSGRRKPPAVRTVLP